MDTACGRARDTALVYHAFATIKVNLHNIKMFHTDCGSEFKSRLTDEIISTFNYSALFERVKGCSRDNAVSEGTFKLVKTELVKNRRFIVLEQLENELKSYIKWFNEKRIHSTLGWLSPLEYKTMYLHKSV
ncbi:MAG: IS3 family transposase [Peptococcaceae bacterium]